MRDLETLSTLKRVSSSHLHPLFSEEEFTAKEAEIEVEGATKEDMEQSAGEASARRDSDDVMEDDTTPPTVPTPTNPASRSTPTIPGTGLLNRRRSGPPGSIPNFPGATTHRDPPPLFNSPVTSPPDRSPLSSPPSQAAGALRLPSQPFVLSGAASNQSPSPWHQLAATSGAPTPSIDGPGSGPGRSSPHLGYPFERLNIGGSWSGANLWGDQSAAPESCRRPSLDSVEPPSSPNQPSRRGSGSSLNPETLAKYRMMAGRASATNAGRREGEDEPGGTWPSDPQSQSQKPPLPAALAKRRASLPKNVLGGLLPPPLVTGSKAPSPLASVTSSPSPSPGLQPLSVSTLSSLLKKDSPLILDLRPPSAYQSSHLPDSHSIPVPSTLLRRPAFNLSKLGQMLSPKGSEALSQWRNKSDIVLIDSDTAALGSNSTLEGVGAKFEREGFAGRLWYVKGGYSAVVSTNLELVTDDDAVAENGSAPAQQSGLQVGKLGRLAFAQESTGSNLQTEKRRADPPSTLDARGDPFASITSTSSTERGKPSLKGMIGQSVLSSQSGSSGKSGSSNSLYGQTKVQPANPFFDNIRQNLELSHGGGHDHISLELPKEAVERADELPPWLAQLARMPEDESAERLAEEFYRIEREEQKRLQAIMDWHSNTSCVIYEAQEGQREMDQKAVAQFDTWVTGDFSDSNYFPYSITAGVEQGTKNRYKNIWPYDFSRVRLETPLEDQGDYINASFVQPRGTNRRYIATQGPLDATYRDFWLLVWEQRVSVIVMLTKQYEGGTIKCGNYWQDGHYGPLHVKLESQKGGEDVKPSDVSGFDFGMGSNKNNEGTNGNIKRTFIVTREDKPDEPPRKVVQVQCTAWPDFDVPERPEILLNLMKDAEEVHQSIDPQRATTDRADQPPLLVHCSAGVGRTGTYIIVDAIVDALRHERQAWHSRSSDMSCLSPDSPKRQTLHATTLPPLSPSPAVQGSLGARQDSSERESGSSGGNSPVGSGTGSGVLSTQGSNSALSGVGSKSGDSSKSVSFLIPPGTSSSGNFASNDALPSVFTSSPSASAPRLGESPTINSHDLTRREGENELDRAIPHLESEAEKMVVDQDESTEDEKRKSLFENLFTKHRGGEGSVSSVGDSDLEITRRLSLTTTSEWGSAERVSQERLARSTLYSVIGMPAPITKSSDRHRTHSPIPDADGLSPVAVVLKGMRMQRMSLVQSLRQYLFVHRAIIQSYLDMVDEDRRQGRDTHINGRPGLVSTAFHHTEMSTDEEGPSKRRASPTELVPEDSKDGKGGANLAKRLSFKKMRQGGLGGLDIKDQKAATRP